MSPPLERQLAAERLIAGGRALLATFSLVALWLDPSEPARFAALAYGLIAGYAAYSLAVLALVSRRAPSGAGFALATHAADLAVFAVVIWVTEGPTSPFFVFFVFTVASAALRWGWAATLWTAAVALVIHLVVGFHAAWAGAGDAASEHDFSLNRFILRSVYLAVVAVLVAYLSRHEKRLQREMAERVTREVALEERMRLARDLHDGVIQSLAAAGMQLASASRTLTSDPEGTARRLAAVEELLVAEQRDLRWALDELRSPDPLRDAVPAPAARLADLARRIESHWRLEVVLRADLDGVPGAVFYEAYRLVQEALVNAARHGGASLAEVDLRVADGRLELTVADDGRGFRFQGRYDLARLDAERCGPVSIKRRVAAAGGDLVLRSGPGGARLEIALPLAARPVPPPTAAPPLQVLAAQAAAR